MEQFMEFNNDDDQGNSLYATNNEMYLQLAINKFPVKLGDLRKTDDK